MVRPRETIREELLNFRIETGSDRDGNADKNGRRCGRPAAHAKPGVGSIVASKAATVTLATTIGAFAATPCAYASCPPSASVVEVDGEALATASKRAAFDADEALTIACSESGTALAAAPSTGGSLEAAPGPAAVGSSASGTVPGVAADDVPADSAPAASASVADAPPTADVPSAAVTAAVPSGLGTSASVATPTPAVADARLGASTYASDICFVDFYFGLDHAESLFKSLYKGDAIEFPSPEKAMEGVDTREWAFAGWFTEAVGGTMVADAKSNPVGGSLLATKSEVEYYAHYEYVGNYDIAFTYVIDGNPAGVAAPASQIVKVKIGTAIGNSVPTPPAAPAGYKFGGWFDASGKAVDPRYVVVDGAMTFEGRYVDAAVEMRAVTFVWGMDGVGSGRQTIGPIDFEKGSVVSFPGASEVSLGSNYALVGWFTGADGSGTKVAEADGVALAGTPANALAADATFHAHYKYVGTYSVSFKYQLDDSAVAAAPPGTKAPGAKNMKLKAESFIGKNAPVAPAIDGCVFEGWYVADASGKPSGGPRTTEQVAVLTVDGPVTYVGVYRAAPKVRYDVEFRWGRAYADEGAVAGDARSQCVSVEEGQNLTGAGIPAE